MEYFTGATNKFYRGIDGQIYLKGDGTTSYKNRLVEGMPIDVYMEMTNLDHAQTQHLTDPRETACMSAKSTKSTNQTMHEEWFIYECEVSGPKKYTRSKRRKHKTSKRNKNGGYKKVCDEQASSDFLIYCRYCEVHHHLDDQCCFHDSDPWIAQCFNLSYDSDEDYWY